MRRRDFIKGVPVWIALPLAARAQPREQKRRVAVLMGGLLSDDLGGQAEAAALEAGLTELGWKLGSNIELEFAGRALSSIKLPSLRMRLLPCGLILWSAARRRLRPS